MTTTAPLAVLSALAEEQQGLLGQLLYSQKVHYAGRDFWSGTLHGQPVVLALSRIGKVAAAITATALIERFGSDRLVFTGVAGGVGHGVEVGDVVVGSGFIQYDMDASPLFPRYQIPLTGQTVFHGDAKLTAQLLRACQSAWDEDAPSGHRAGIHHKVHYGLIATGDRFVSGAREVEHLVHALQSVGHTPLAVEMEGAAVAQVCHDHGVAFAAVRTISDRADDTAHVDFAQFVNEVASAYAMKVISRLIQTL